MITDLKTVPFKPQKPLLVSWNTWRKGLNTLLRETEIDGSELVNATNLLLQGSGVPTKRWGSMVAFIASPLATQMGRFLLPIKDASDNIQILALTDSGILSRQNNASYISITGASFASGYNVEAAQLGGNVYLTSSQTPMAKYDFNKLIPFNSLTTPTSVQATNFSGATGSTTYTWSVTATSRTGETIASTPVSLASLPQNLTNTLTRISWTLVSAASGDLTGYNVYRSYQGNLAWVGGVDSSTNKFDDPGIPPPDPTHVSPVADTTAGYKAKYVIRFQDRLILAGIPGSPTKVVISGRWPQQERFDTFAGAGSVLIEPDSGEDITGLGIYYRTQSSTQTIVAYKERSVWEVSLDTQNTSNAAISQFPVLVPSYRLLTGSQGCSSHRSIIPVENDVMFVNRRGVYILRYEPNLFNVINANEISAKIRPFFEGLVYGDIVAATGMYADKKYVLSFPTSGQSIVFDRERLSFTGPWKTPFSVNKWSTYIDSSGSERWLAMDSTDNVVHEFTKALADDSGTAIATGFKTKKEDFGDWTLYKTLSEVYMNFRNMQGTTQVNIYIEDRTGTVTSAKSFTIVGTSSLGTSGLGTDKLGTNKLGVSADTSAIIAGELQRKAILYKTTRTMQVEILTSGSTDKYELLGIKGIAIPQARGNNPTSWNV